jgi:uncharacterized protein
MLRDLESLVQLQEVDLRIHEQELAKEQLPATVKELELIIEKAKNNHAAVAAKFDAAEKELTGFEDLIKKAQENLDKSQTRLNSIKTNREYDAVHAEIESAKNLLHTSESRKTKLTEEVSKLKAATETAQSELEKTISENDPKIAHLNSQIAAIDSVITGITKERNAIVPQVSKTTLRTYDQILKRRKNGKKVVSLVDRMRTCTVCFKMLEPQLMNEIKRSTKLIMCQNCGSIFVWNGNKDSEAQA